MEIPKETWITAAVKKKVVYKLDAITNENIFYLKFGKI